MEKILIVDDSLLQAAQLKSIYDSMVQAAQLQVADAMLYDAKRFGRNQVVWADEQLRQLCETGKKADPSKLLTCGL